MTRSGMNGGAVSVCDATRFCDGGFESGTTVAADGTYSILVPNGTYRLTFLADGGSQQITFPTTPTVSGLNVIADLSVTLQSMSGTVTATGGVPLDHVAAVAYSDATTVVTSTYTLSDGKYTIWITPGVYRVTVNAYQLPSVWYRAAADFASATNVDVSTSSATGIDVVFPAVTVSGTISGAAGGGVSSLVTVTSATCSTPSTAGVAYSSSPDGSYAVWVPENSSYFVNASVGGSMTYYVASGSGTVDCGGASTVTTVTGQGATGINITVPAYRISGTVRDSAQQPIANMQVSASDATSGFRDLMYTGTDGIYSVTVLPGDTITLNVSPPSQYVATSIGQISVMTSNISQDFMLVNAHLVSGRVIRTGDSLALPFATVTMWTSGGGFVTDSVTDSLGQYGMWVAGGTYRVSAQATGYTTTWWMNAADLASANDIPISNADVPLSDIALP